MNVSRKLVIGSSEYVIAFDAESPADFVRLAAFLDSLPTEGPNGEKDLVFMYRTPKDYEYYSIISQKAGMEFKFGQHKDRPGSLFAKGWEPLYQNEQGEGQPVQNVGLGGLGTTAAAAPTPAAAPQATTPAAGLGAATKTAPKAAAKPAAAPAQVQNQAQNILSKFGI